jgi:hypothetical protein
MSKIPATEEGTRARFKGKLVFRDDVVYENARVGGIFHSRHPNRYPAAVLRAETENDVVEGVRLARERRWQVAVRSGGHSFPVWSLRDDGLMIDLSAFKEMSYDEQEQVASATAAVTGGGELNSYLRQFNRFFQAGNCPSVALGGFLLQGGIGWNFRGWGYSSECVVAIDVVTADGELVRADEHQNADLYWSARGAGPGYFGVITRFYLRTRPIPRALTSIFQAYPIEYFANVLPWLFETQKKMSPDVHLVAGSMVPPFPVPGAEGKLIFYVWGAAFCDTREEALAALSPLGECPFLSAALLVDADKATSIQEQSDLGAGIHPQGLRYRVDSTWVNDNYVGVTEASRALIAGRPVNELGHTFFLFALPREAPDMAMSLRGECMIGAYVIYDSQEDDDKYHQWLQEAMQPMQPYSIGQYWGDSDQTFREVKCLTDEAFLRLEEIRKVRDPDHVFSGYLAKPTGFRNINAWEEVHRPKEPSDRTGSVSITER